MRVQRTSKLGLNNGKRCFRKTYRNPIKWHHNLAFCAGQRVHTLVTTDGFLCQTAKMARGFYKTIIIVENDEKTYAKQKAIIAELQETSKTKFVHVFADIFEYIVSKNMPAKMRFNLYLDLCSDMISVDNLVKLQSKMRFIDLLGITLAGRGSATYFERLTV